MYCILLHVMGVSRVQVLKLYKDILRYSNQLIYTDKEYFINRVKNEFRNNKDLTDQSDIEFFYKVCLLKNLIVYKSKSLF